MGTTFNGTYTVLLSNRYDYVSQKNGVRYRGTKIECLGNCHVNENGKRGLQLEKFSGSYELDEKFTKLPGKYELVFSMVPGYQDSINIKCLDAKLVPGPANVDQQN